MHQMQASITRTGVVSMKEIAERKRMTDEYCDDETREKPEKPPTICSIPMPSQHHTSPTPCSKLTPVNHRRRHPSHKIPTLKSPDHKAGNPMSHNLTDATLRSGGDKLGILQRLKVLLLDIPGAEIDSNGRAHGGDGIIAIQDAAIRVAGRVADGIDTVGAGRGDADGFGIREDLVALVEPGGGQEGGVGRAAGGVDVDVDGPRGAVAEDELGFPRGQLRR